MSDEGLACRIRCVVKNPTLLQAFRAMQAVAECGLTVIIEPAERPTWDYASRWFDLPYTEGSASHVLPIGIDHRSPAVQIGDLERPLLFPHRFFELYRDKWSHRHGRPVFFGNPTPDRRRVIKSWRRGAGRRGIEVRWSRRGRHWPNKAWDSDYASALGSAQFALCPDGDFVWTYRFFEAVAAGAVPIVQSVAPLYDGFVFGRMDNGLEGAEWTVQAALANFELARDMLTVPHSVLRDHVLNSKFESG
jgi:hypothetical protein